MSLSPVIGDVIATLPHATLVIDAEERIVAANTAACALLGQGILNRHFITVLRQPAVAEAVELCFGDTTARVVPYLAGSAGADLSYDTHLQQIAASGHVLVSFQDVTQMTQAGLMRRDFVANVSHELRTPLTSLMGFIETLQGPAREDAAARDRFLEIMGNEAGRMNRLVGDLLSLSRVEAEERVRPTQRLNLVAVLTSTLRNLTPLATQQQITLTPDYGDQPVHVLGDSDQLLQVFTNLVENAVKYGGDGKQVHVIVQAVGSDASLRAPAVHITVKDQGPGIDPHHLPRLTERFYRADSHRNRSLGGTGLGLAIVKHILNRHRGRLRIASELGKGAEFTVVLPLDIVSDAG